MDVRSCFNTNRMVYLPHSSFGLVRIKYNNPEAAPVKPEPQPMFSFASLSMRHAEADQLSRLNPQHSLLPGD